MAKFDDTTRLVTAVCSPTSLSSLEDGPSHCVFLFHIELQLVHGSNLKQGYVVMER